MADTDDWYDPQESEADLEHPKYWSEEDQEVFVGIKQRDAAIPLSTLCGTYFWIYEFPEPGVSDPIDVPYAPGTRSLHDPKGPGYLTITCPRKTNPTLKNITGTVVHFGKEARFSGIKRAKDRDKKNLATNHWEFVSFKWKENYGDQCQDDGCALLALDVSDDEGDPFVIFRSATPGRGGDSWYLDIAAKKERRSKEYGLSSAEMKRLGMQTHYPDVRAAALAAKQEEEESESESESESDTDNESSPVVKRRKRKPDSNATDDLIDVRPRKRRY